MVQCYFPSHLNNLQICPRRESRELYGNFRRHSDTTQWSSGTCPQVEAFAECVPSSPPYLTIEQMDFVCLFVFFWTESPSVALARVQ